MRIFLSLNKSFLTCWNILFLNRIDIKIKYVIIGNHLKKDKKMTEKTGAYLAGENQAKDFIEKFKHNIDFIKGFVAGLTETVTGSQFDHSNDEAGESDIPVSNDGNNHLEEGSGSDDPDESTQNAETWQVNTDRQN